MCLYHIFFIPSPVGSHLGCFHTLAVENNATVNSGVQVALLDPAFIPFAYIPRSSVHCSWRSFAFSTLLEEDRRRQLRRLVSAQPTCRKGDYAPCMELRAPPWVHQRDWKGKSIGRQRQPLCSEKL